MRRLPYNGGAVDCVARRRIGCSVSALSSRAWDDRLARGSPRNVDWHRTLRVGGAPSLSCRLLAPDQSSVFFQPVHLAFELAELRLSCGLQLLFLFLPSPTAARQEARRFVVDRSLPLGTLSRMDAILGRQCVDRLLAPNGRQGNPCFARAAVLTSLRTPDASRVSLVVLAYSMV